MDDFDGSDDLEEIFSPDPDEERAPPCYRLTIRDGRVMLTNWVPWLARNGPNTKLLQERDEAGVAIADLTVLGEDDKEIAVRFYTDGGDLAEAERVVLDWATTVGYRRVWLSDRLESIEPAPEKLGTAHVRCPACGVTWRDSSPEFWLTVRGNGAFPHWCAICGCEMPQWILAPTKPKRRRPPADRRGSPDGWRQGAGERRHRERKT